MVGKFAARDVEKQAYELKEFERQLRRQRRERAEADRRNEKARRSTP